MDMVGQAAMARARAMAVMVEMAPVPAMGVMEETAARMVTVGTVATAGAAVAGGGQVAMAARTAGLEAEVGAEVQARHPMGTGARAARVATAVEAMDLVDPEVLVGPAPEAVTAVPVDLVGLEAEFGQADLVERAVRRRRVVVVVAEMAEGVGEPGGMEDRGEIRPAALAVMAAMVETLGLMAITMEDKGGLLVPGIPAGNPVVMALPKR